MLSSHPEEIEDIYNYLKSKYHLIREAYKHVAATAPAGGIPSIGSNCCTELFLKMSNSFIDYKSLKTSDVDL
jgi:hypothetical protein